jgi:low temperature requirement protein LtrA
MWWIYFDRPVHDLLTTFRRAFAWGYGHYVVFASAAAVGAGLAANVDHVTGHSKVSAVAVGYAVALPVAVYVACLWVLHDRPEYRRTRLFGPLTVVLVLLSPFTGQVAPRKYQQFSTAPDRHHEGGGKNHFHDGLLAIP